MVIPQATQNQSIMKVSQAPTILESARENGGFQLDQDLGIRVYCDNLPIIPAHNNSFNFNSPFHSHHSTTFFLQGYFPLHLHKIPQTQLR
jgi:hypothetical protein